MRVIWSKKALLAYHSIIDFLLFEWSEKSAENFIDQVQFKNELIKTHPEAFEKTDFGNVHKIIITKQITVFFRFSNLEIELLRFWNNAQSPKNLTL